MGELTPPGLDTLSQAITVREIVARLDMKEKESSYFKTELEYLGHRVYKANGGETFEAALRNLGQALEAVKSKLTLEAMEEKAALDAMKDRLIDIETRLQTSTSRVWAVLLDLIKLAIVGVLGWLLAHMYPGMPPIPVGPGSPPPSVSSPQVPH